MQIYHFLQNCKNGKIRQKRFSPDIQNHNPVGLVVSKYKLRIYAVLQFSRSVGGMPGFEGLYFHVITKIYRTSLLRGQILYIYLYICNLGLVAISSFISHKTWTSYLNYK